MGNPLKPFLILSNNCFTISDLIVVVVVVDVISTVVVTGDGGWCGASCPGRVSVSVSGLGTETEDS